MLCLVRPPIVLLAQRADVVDLAGVVEIMLDQHGDDPACLLQFAPVGPSWSEQLSIIEEGDTLAETLLARAQPSKRRRHRRERVAALNQGIVPRERRVTKSVVVVHELAAADVLNDGADRAAASRRDPGPVLGREGAQIAQQGMPGHVRSLEGLIEEMEKLGDDHGAHTTQYTLRPVRDR